MQSEMDWYVFYLSAILISELCVNRQIKVYANPLGSHLNMLIYSNLSITFKSTNSLSLATTWGTAMSDKDLKARA